MMDDVLPLIPIYNGITSGQRPDNRTLSQDLHDVKWTLRWRYSLRDPNSMPRHVARMVMQ